MYYTIYKITNQINGKIYIGSHKTKNLDDNYMGSGKYLKRSQDKHGMDKFTKDILFVYDNPEEMYAKEAEIVNEDFLAEENTYNLKVGGFGGWDYINANPEKFPMRRLDNLVDASVGQAAWRLKYDTDPEFRNKSLDNVKSMQLRCREMYPEGTFKGKQHTDETKAKIGASASINQKGCGNSQYGTRWIHSISLEKSKKIPKGDIIPDGWLPGRKIKF